MSRPLITVLIDTYNHERFAEQAVVSVLEQDFPQEEMEILAVDDGSTDRTAEILRKFSPRVRVIEKKNGGQGSAFNLGIPQAKGQFISFLDGDDWWLPNKLTRAMETFRKEPDLGFVGHGDILVFPDGRRQLHVPSESVRFCAGNLEGALLFRVRKSFLGTCRMTLRSEIANRVLPVPEVLRVQADEYLFTLAAAVCNVRLLAEPLFCYRFHDSNGFQMTATDTQRLKRKQQVLADVAKALQPQLLRLGAAPDATRAIIESVQLEADQLRLQIDGGMPWETAKTEWKLYKMWHVNPPLSHRLFKVGVLFGTLFMPPKWFYAIRQNIAGAGVYTSARNRLLPVPERRHIQTEWLKE
jgi:hypothetical protein